MDAIIYACDIGSTRQRRFAWVRLSREDKGRPSGSHDISRLVDSLEVDLNAGCRIAMGFEAPLAIPVPRDPRLLSTGRAGEGQRAWSAPAGGYVATLAVHQTAWILSRIVSLAKHAGVTVDYRDWDSGRKALLVWEAFVSEGAHSDEHIRDAATAAIGFEDGKPPYFDSFEDSSDVPSLSLIGSVLLWNGLTDDISILARAPIVVRPKVAYVGDIGAL